MKDELIIAIDGTAGAGKTSVSKALASKLEYSYIDTGALYRGFALKADREGVDIHDDENLKKLCSGIDLSFKTVNGASNLFLDGVDVSKEIREPHMSMKASDISAKPIVREALLNVQRKLGESGRVVLEGRDIGSVVFPNADVKFYLDANPEERAKRRHKDFVAAGKEVCIDELVNDIKRRDKNDSTRAHAPLKRTEDAIYIDSTIHPIDEVVELMLVEVRKKM